MPVEGRAAYWYSKLRKAYRRSSPAILGGLLFALEGEGEMDGNTRKAKKDDSARKTVTKGVRMTEAEAMVVRTKAEREHLSEGAWMRMKLFDEDHEYIPFEIRSAFGSYLYEIGKAASDIHTVARDCQRHKSVDAYDVRRLQDSVEELKKILTEIYENVKEAVRHGSDKTSED